MHLFKHVDLGVSEIVEDFVTPASLPIDADSRSDAWLLSAGENVGDVAFADAGGLNDGLYGGFAHTACSHITDTIASGKIRDSANTVLCGLSYIADVERNVPHFLREWREFREMTQDELADAVKTSKSVISDLERGKLQLSPKWLRRLAPVLKTQPGHILDHAPQDLDNDIIDIWAHIPDEDRPQAAAILRTFQRRTGTND